MCQRGCEIGKGATSRPRSTGTKKHLSHEGKSLTKPAFGGFETENHKKREFILPLLYLYYMKDDKKLLFERMEYLNPDFKQPINEETDNLNTFDDSAEHETKRSKTYVKATDLPPQIIDWAKSIVGSGFQNKITIEKTGGEIEINMPWHDADRETHQFFKLSDNGAESMGKEVWSETSMLDEPYGKVKIPSGYILATVGTYPKRLRVVVANDAMDMISNNNETLDKLSDEAMVALNNAQMLKSPYRQKFNDNVYQELISLGLLNPRKAITIEGRNLIKSADAIEKLRALKKKDQDENGWNSKYKIEV